MNPESVDRITGEAARVRERYARRTGLPARRYDPFEPAAVFIAQGRERVLIEMLSRFGLDRRIRSGEIFEIGCGTGSNLTRLRLLGADVSRLHGIDLLEDRVRAAREAWPELDIRQGEASALPWEDGRFDIVLQSTVFTSILDDRVQERVAAEMMRVLRPDGAILWYDFRVSNPRNPDVRGVPRARVKALFPGMGGAFRTVTLAPPIVRALVPRATWLARVLEGLPWLRTHYWAVLWWPEGRTRGS